jgi:hypothetical protein
VRAPACIVASLVLASCATAPPPPLLVAAQPAALAYSSSPRPLFIGPPGSGAAESHYFGPSGEANGVAPLEDYGQPRVIPVTDVRELERPPGEPYRPLFPFYVESASPPELDNDLRAQAGRWGADAFVRVAQIEHAPVWTHGWHWHALTPGSFGAWGAAIRFAKPGSEAFTGLACSQYEPYGPGARSRVGQGPNLAWISAAQPPSMGLTQGPALALSWKVVGRPDAHGKASGSCHVLADAIAQAGPGAAVDMTVLYPSSRPADRMMTVPLSRHIGVQVSTDPRDVPVIREVLPGSPAAMSGARTGDRIVAISGQPVSDVRAVQQLIATGAATQSLTVDRACGPRA